MSGSASTQNLALLQQEPGAQVGDQNYVAKFTSGTGQASETTKNPTSTFTQFAALSNMAGAGFIRVRIVDGSGVLVMAARIPLLTDA